MQALRSNKTGTMPTAQRSQVAVSPRSLATHAQQAVAPALRSVEGVFAQRAQMSLLANRVQRLTQVACKATENGNGVVAKASRPMDIVFVSAEVAPWSKTGGLGDVVGGLPIEMVKRGHKVITIAPRYDQYYDGWDTSVVLDVDGEQVRFFHCIKKGVHRVFIDHPWFLAKVWGKTGSKLYGPKSGADYLDNHKRFTLFCKAAIEACRALPFGPGEDCVIVANDWHSALIPVMIKDVYQPKGQFKNTKVALCIHNIAFQGRMWEDSLRDMKLPATSAAKLAFQDPYPKVYTEKDPLGEDESSKPSGKMFKKLNWLKAGIIAADKLITVSPNYATEISRDAAGGVEMDTFIRAAGGIEGIVNGMDIEEWNPKTDKFLTVAYDDKSVYAGKAAAKEALQAEVGLPVDPSAPLFAFIGRLEEQKGVDVLLEAIPKIIADGKSQVVILGTGKASFEKLVKALDSPRAKGIVKFSAPLAHLITGGADFMVVPSRFEPCGLIQLHAMHYGTVPIVASTGGLVDTVKEGVTGFHMGALDTDGLEAADVAALAATCKRAAEVYSTPTFKNMVYNCISQDLSWARPALKWEGVLEEVKYGTGRTKAASVAVPVMMTIPGPVPAVSYAPTTRPAADLTFGPAKTGGAPSAPGAAAPASNGNGASAAPKPAAAPLKYTYSSRPASGAASPAAPASNGTSSSNGGAVPTPARQVTKPMVGARTTKSE